MINFNEERTTAVVYTCGICNLNCRYCTIDKNPALLQIDKELEESFQGDYYFNRIKEYFPRRDQLKSLETWGGEPFLKMHRIYPLVHKLIEYYPYFDNMYSSTNFSYDEWLDEFMGLMQCFADYPYRSFKYLLQLSIDGPEYINDANRGVGVTKRCLANFNKLVNLMQEGKFPSNVSLTITLKGTWDLDCIHKLNDKQKLIEFFQFLENNYIEPIKKLNIENIQISNDIPNTAVPAPVTKHDGIIFSELVQKTREIEAENFIKHYFKYYEKITPYGNGQYCTCTEYRWDVNRCGSGSTMVGFLPHNMISACHEGFTLLVEEYKKFAAQRSDKDLTVTLNKFFELHSIPMCLTDDQYVNHERKMSYLNPASTVQMTNAVTLIIALAMAGLIEEKYVNEGEALHAAKYVLGSTAFCPKANYAVTGSFCLEPTGFYILLLNGALDYLEEDSCNGNFN